LMSASHGIIPPQPGLYPEKPRVQAVPNNVFCVVLLEPIIQVTTWGPILCAPGWDGDDPPWTEGTSIPELLPIRREGPWTVGSYIHDLSYAMGICWEIHNGCLHERELTRDECDRAWAEGHYVKRDTDKAGPVITAIHYRGLRLGSWAAWNHYRADETEHAARLRLLRGTAGRSVERFLTMQ